MKKISQTLLLSGLLIISSGFISTTVQANPGQAEFEACAICLETVVKTSCGHMYHPTCLKEWMDTAAYENPVYRNTPGILRGTVTRIVAQRCPACRADINRRDQREIRAAAGEESPLGSVNQRLERMERALESRSPGRQVRREATQQGSTGEDLDLSQALRAQQEELRRQHQQPRPSKWKQFWGEVGEAISEDCEKFANKHLSKLEKVANFMDSLFEE